MHDVMIKKNTPLLEGLGKINQKITEITYGALKKAGFSDEDLRSITKDLGPSNIGRLAPALQKDIEEYGIFVYQAILQNRILPKMEKPVQPFLRSLYNNENLQGIYLKDVKEVINWNKLYTAMQTFISKPSINLTQITPPTSTALILDNASGDQKGMQPFYLIIARTFELEVAHLLKLFKLNAMLLKCVTSDATKEFCKGMLTVDDGKNIAANIRKIGDALKSLYEVCVKMLTIQGEPLKMVMPKSVQDLLADLLNNFANSLHMKYMNVAEKFVNYAKAKLKSSDFSKRLCKYIDTVSPDYTGPDIPGPTTTEKKAVNTYIEKIKTENMVIHYVEMLKKIYAPLITLDQTETLPIPSVTIINKCQQELANNLMRNLSLLIQYKPKFINIADILKGDPKAVEKAVVKFMAENKDNTVTMGQLTNLLEQCDVNCPIFVASEASYIKFVKFYENVSGAVRVYVRLKDNDVTKPCGTMWPPKQQEKCALSYNTENPNDKKWIISSATQNGKAQDIVIANEANINLYDYISGNVREFGPFFKVIPPYDTITPNSTINANGKTTSTTYRKVTNEEIAQSYIDVNNLCELLLKDDQNLVLFTYGYSGSGKTFTLFGEKDTIKDIKGLVHKFLDRLLEQKATVTLSNAYTMYGYIRSDYRFDEKIATSNINQVLNKETYTDVIVEKIVKKYMQSKAGDLNEDDFIKNTPNNPESSRGFLVVEFDIVKDDRKNKLCVVDMAGNEHPYDIMMKTLPTFYIPSKKGDIKTNLLNSTNSYVTKEEIAKQIYSNIKSEIDAAITMLGETLNTFRHVVFGITGSIANFIKKGDKDFFTKKLDLNKIYDDIFKFDKTFITTMPMFTQIETYLTKFKHLMKYYILTIIHEVFIYSKEAKKADKKDVSIIDDQIINKIIQPFLTTKQLANDENMKRFIFFSKVTTSKNAQNLIEHSFDIHINYNSVMMTILAIYFIGPLIEKTNEFRELIGNTTIDKLQKHGETNIKGVDKAIQNELYGGGMDIKKLDTLKRIRYLLTTVLNDPMFTNNTFDFQTYDLNRAMFKVTIKYNQSKEVQAIITPVDENLNALFAAKDIVIKVPSETNEAKPREIVAPPSYFERIVREGYYINQVNYELIRFFYLRSKSDDLMQRGKISGAIAYDNMTLEKYNPMTHIATGTEVNDDAIPKTEWCYTQILSLLGTILSSNSVESEEKNKYIMICNIRPEVEKRFGALQTLELVKTLSST